MKLSIISLACLVGVTFGSLIGVASASNQDATMTHVAPAPVEVGYNIKLPESAPITLKTTVIVVKASHKNTAPKHFVCGQKYTNAIGGVNSDCSWR